MEGVQHGQYGRRPRVYPVTQFASGKTCPSVHAIFSTGDSFSPTPNPKESVSIKCEINAHGECSPNDTRVNATCSNMRH